MQHYPFFWAREFIERNKKQLVDIYNFTIATLDFLEREEESQRKL